MRVIALGLESCRSGGRGEDGVRSGDKDLGWACFGVGGGGEEAGELLGDVEDETVWRDIGFICTKGGDLQHSQGCPGQQCETASDVLMRTQKTRKRRAQRIQDAGNTVEVSEQD